MPAHVQGQRRGPRTKDTSGINDFKDVENRETVSPSLILAECNYLRLRNVHICMGIG